MKRFGRRVGVDMLGWVIVMLAVAAAPSAHASPSVPVLGSPAHLAPTGTGWGTVRPAAVFNGGDPAGSAFHLVWRDWGQRRTFGRGLTYIFRPEGGYYGRPASILFRGQDLGFCADGSYGYRQLWFRIAHRPGHHLGRHCHPWTGGDGDLCRRT